MTSASVAGPAIWAALQACPPLDQPSPARDDLWLAVRAGICTRTAADIAPFGSACHIRVDAEHATDELIAAMSWLMHHESAARCLSPTELFIALRGLATRGADGSARRTQADALHGMTGVPAGGGVRWRSLDDGSALR